MLAKLSKIVNSFAYHITVAILFITMEIIGYFFLGGLSFVQGWGGGIAASIATLYLVFKSQGYWAWMIVNAGLWTYLFFYTGLPMLAWLQVSIMVFSLYGIVQWYRDEKRLVKSGEVVLVGGAERF